MTLDSPHIPSTSFWARQVCGYVIFNHVDPDIFFLFVFLLFFFFYPLYLTGTINHPAKSNAPGTLLSASHMSGPGPGVWMGIRQHVRIPNPQLSGEGVGLHLLSHSQPFGRSGRTRGVSLSPEQRRSPVDWRSSWAPDGPPHPALPDNTFRPKKQMRMLLACGSGVPQI